MPIITLTTDFGTRDGYVGAIKGVIASGTHGQVPIIDIAHDIPRGDVAHAAWVVATSTREFPDGTIHVVVVDPGVGGGRREVIAKGGGHWYVAPDNGVLAYVKSPTRRVWQIQDERGPKAAISQTFHGRDIFAHAAVALATGVGSVHAGAPTELLGSLPWGVREPGGGRIVHVDHFGNLITDLPASEAGSAVTILGHTLPLVGTYEDVPSGYLLAYIGSARTVEIAVRDGRADGQLIAPRGTPIVPAAAGGGPYR